MSIDQLDNKYMQLRSALASAYEEPVWDSRRIDTLTDEIASTEHALAVRGDGAVARERSASRVSVQAAGIAVAHI